MAEPWVIDAQALTDEKVEGANGLLYRSEAITRFLEEPHALSRAVVAPKGFGKTFLLKMRRIILRKADYQCAPLNLIVDRPGFAIPFLKAEVHDFLRMSKPWESIWQICFVLSVINSVSDHESVNRMRDRVMDPNKSAQWRKFVAEAETRPFIFWAICSVWIWER